MSKQGENGISWCDDTWNPVRGCSRVSEGCRNCYAERVAHRFSGEGMPYEGLVANGRWNGTVREVLSVMEQPIRWKRPRRIFVNSMSDLFHENVDPVTIERVFGVMAVASQHTFQVLTKRPERAVEWFKGWHLDESVMHMGEWHARKVWPTFTWDGRGPDPAAYGLDGWAHPEKYKHRRPWPGWPLPNVHIGVSVEDQKTADERIPHLLQVPAALRFLSCEPLLGPVSLTQVRYQGMTEIDCLNGLHGFPIAHAELPAGTDPIGWVIAGGESGSGARPAYLTWFRRLRDQCIAAGVPFHFKQWGEWGPSPSGELYRQGKAITGRELDGRTWDEFPGATP